MSSVLSLHCNLFFVSTMRVGGEFALHCVTKFGTKLCLGASNTNDFSHVDRKYPISLDRWIESMQWIESIRVGWKAERIVRFMALPACTGF